MTKLRAWSYWYSVFTLFTARGQQSSMLTNTMSSPELAMHISTNMHDAVPGAKQTHETGNLLMQLLLKLLPLVSLLAAG